MKGITEQPNGGYRVFLRINGRPYFRRFKPGTPLPEMQDQLDVWRLRALGKIGPETRTEGTTFADDVRAYLSTVRSMTTYAERASDLQHWLGALGRATARQDITAVQVRTVLEDWRRTKAASTVNHRRTALMHLFTVLDGRSARNPAKDVPRYKEPDPETKAVPLAALEAVLKRMAPSQTKARLEVMRWTGWPHKQLARLEPTHIRWKVAVYVTARRKGAGVKGIWLPLLPQAWKALREFKRRGCWGTFSHHSMYKSFRLAAGKVAADTRQPKWIREAVADIYPYQLRHTFLTIVALATKDDRVVGQLARHSDRRQADRYTGASVDPRVASGLAAVANFLKPEKSRRTKSAF